jgi:predicted aconitase
VKVYKSLGEGVSSCFFPPERWGGKQITLGALNLVCRLQYLQLPLFDRQQKKKDELNQFSAAVGGTSKTIINHVSSLSVSLDLDRCAVYLSKHAARLPQLAIVSAGSREVRQVAKVVTFSRRGFVH